MGQKDVRLWRCEGARGMWFVARNGLWWGHSVMVWSVGPVEQFSSLAVQQPGFTHKGVSQGWS